MSYSFATTGDLINTGDFEKFIIKIILIKFSHLDNDIYN